MLKRTRMKDFMCQRQDLYDNIRYELGACVTVMLELRPTLETRSRAMYVVWDAHWCNSYLLYVFGYHARSMPAHAVFRTSHPLAQLARMMQSSPIAPMHSTPPTTFGTQQTQPATSAQHP